MHWTTTSLLRHAESVKMIRSMNKLGLNVQWQKTIEFLFTFNVNFSVSCILSNWLSYSQLLILLLSSPISPHYQSSDEMRGTAWEGRRRSRYTLQFRWNAWEGRRRSKSSNELRDMAWERRRRSKYTTVQKKCATRRGRVVVAQGTLQFPPTLINSKMNERFIGSPLNFCWTLLNFGEFLLNRFWESTEFIQNKTINLNFRIKL